MALGNGASGQDVINEINNKLDVSGGKMSGSLGITSLTDNDGNILLQPDGTGGICDSKGAPFFKCTMGTYTGTGITIDEIIQKYKSSKYKVDYLISNKGVVRHETLRADESYGYPYTYVSQNIYLGFKPSWVCVFRNSYHIDDMYATFIDNDLINITDTGFEVRIYLKWKDITDTSISYTDYSNVSWNTYVCDSFFLKEFPISDNVNEAGVVYRYIAGV